MDQIADAIEAWNRNHDEEYPVTGGGFNPNHLGHGNTHEELLNRVATDTGIPAAELREFFEQELKEDEARPPEAEWFDED
jgi:hypothetical protein